MSKVKALTILISVKASLFDLYVARHFICGCLIYSSYEDDILTLSEIHPSPPCTTELEFSKSTKGPLSKYSHILKF